MKRHLSRLKSWLDAALSFFYPEACQACGNERATAAEGFVGAGCRQRVQFIQPPYCERCGLPYEGELTTTFECSNCRDVGLRVCHARSAVAARGLVLDVIHRYKYHRALWFEPFLAGLLARAAAPALQHGPWNIIVPVPLHPLKQREREFNQAERLARRLSRATGLPVARRVLRRVTPTRSQTRLPRAERAANVRRAFALGRGGEGVRGKHVVVLDDVLTTGATTSACAGVLLDAGAERVCVWTLARGLIN